MDVKIGFQRNPRELVVSSPEDRDSLMSRIEEAIAAGEGVFRIEDGAGSTHLVRAAEIAYVEVGSESHRSVGFAN